MAYERAERAVELPHPIEGNVFLFLLVVRVARRSVDPDLVVVGSSLLSYECTYLFLLLPPDSNIGDSRRHIEDLGFIFKKLEHHTVQPENSKKMNRYKKIRTIGQGQFGDVLWFETDDLRRNSTP